jgi:fermentation-respiration switch protein FrsA (DUF1100 family)
LLAGRDIIVPARFGQALFDGYNGPKKLWIHPNAGHNTLDYDPRAAWWKDVSDFLLRHRTSDFQVASSGGNRVLDK